MIWTALRMSNSINRSRLSSILKGLLAQLDWEANTSWPQVLNMHETGIPLQTAFQALTGRGYHIKLE